ncbi:MAG: transcription-repair coupling factor [Actinomycetota bacterium]|nr:transcription-repair coupling factor [Actinomycetota bacterium]
MQPLSSEEKAGKGLRCEMDDARFVLEKVRSSPLFGELVSSCLPPGESRISCRGVGVPLLCSLLYEAFGGPMVVAVSQEPLGLSQDIAEFSPGEAFDLPEPLMLEEVFHPYDETASRRLKSVQRLSEGRLIVVGPEAFAAGVPPLMKDPWPLKISVGCEMKLELLLEALVEGGYTREYQVEGWGHFALRGGILDIFPPARGMPIRIELLGDRAESIREFNVLTQRSTGKLEGVEILPFSYEGVSVKSEPFPGTRVVLVDPEEIDAKLSRLFPESQRKAKDLAELWGGDLVEVDTFGSGQESSFTFPAEAARQYAGDIPSAMKDWKELIHRNWDVLLLLENHGQLHRLREIWNEEFTDITCPRMGIGSTRRGFQIPALKTALFCYGDIVKRKERPRHPSRLPGGAPVSSYAELEVGGYVVHADQGIGIYRGLRQKEALGISREYLLIEYAEGDRLYVPTSELMKVQRYTGVENPTIHRLRARDWSRARKKARKSAEKTARELLELYLQRKSEQGFAFSADGPWQGELEDSFPYEDTPDQARATREVKENMESEEVMDRLICGDVGYGKTEVAIRAAFKCVADSKQTAVLVPTTILARQHYETFKERLAPFPVRVEMLSRFLSEREQKRVVSSVREGKTDIVIGTHRLLGEDVSFRDLGLLVIDEEHKFGVEHKEKLKRLKRNVDTLTLSATPIPRTFQMMLSGIREVSLIDTPPEDRHPVFTYVGKFGVELARRAIAYELSRGGQVFYLHNRIETIEKVRDEVRALAPGASVAVAHGSMDEEELDRVMLEFADGIYDILVCTTIIESGLDLPNVNTLIVDRADLLGLGQLYQVRGRVGRSERRAYAYFLYPEKQFLTAAAKARLAAMSEMASLGSGMRVAMRDLEIRGAGNLLGREQSGHIEAVGFELYCELLRESIDALKGKTAREARLAAVELPVDAYIPEEYISDEEMRVEEYRRLILSGRNGMIDEYEEELVDRFGKMPPQTRRMIEIEKLRSEAGEAGLESLIMKKGEIQMRFLPGEKPRAHDIRSLARVGEGGFLDGIYFDEAEGKLSFRLKPGAADAAGDELISWLREIIGRLPLECEKPRAAIG